MVGVDGTAIGPCMMVNVSATGACLVLESSTPLPERFMLVLSHNGSLQRRCTVAWQTGTTAGIHFVAG
jgi:hypothetical protein